MGREFVGIEGYPGIDFVETFSKPELEQILQENGFSKFKFYYPYPDYKFPAVIYSDEYLPKPGELEKTGNRPDFRIPSNALPSSKSVILSASKFR